MRRARTTTLAAACTLLALLTGCGPGWSLGFDTDLLGDGSEPVLLGTRFTLSVDYNPFGPVIAVAEDASVLRLVEQDTCGSTSVEPGVVDDWEQEMQECQDDGLSWGECEDELGERPDEPEPYGGVV